MELEIKKIESESNEAVNDTKPTIISSDLKFNKMKEDFLTLMQKCEDGSELEILRIALLPEPYSLWQKCMEVRMDLMNIFGRYYPFVRVDVFGSTVMGTAFKDSDFDFHIVLSPVPSDLTPSKQIHQAIDVLTQSQMFTDFVPVVNARVPCLKCYHTKNQYSCDLVFSEGYGVLNSIIIAHLLNYDPRIHVLVTIIKYWMKVHEFVGSDKMSNYAVLWLIMFYLQKTFYPILPPIYVFQLNIQPYFVNGYNYAFNQALPRFTMNSERLSMLLLGFFGFYKEFDFKSQIICPLYGRALQKHNLFNNNPIEFVRYEQLKILNPRDGKLDLNKCICIQDPFKLTHTLSCRMNAKQFEEFQNKLKSTFEVIKQNLSESGETKKLFIDIMDKNKLCEL